MEAVIRAWISAYVQRGSASRITYKILSGYESHDAFDAMDSDTQPQNILSPGRFAQNL
jgi:hypothetical protein